MLTRRTWLIVGGVALTVVLLLIVRRPLAEWLWPNTRIEALRTSAAKALVQGRLTAADGTGARELYEAAVALDPDRPEAREGLARVGQAALAQARRDLAAGDHARAHESLALARALSVPRAQVDRVAVELRQREAEVAGIARMLERAAAARADQHLHGDPDAALELYLAVLALQPDNTNALEGREDTVADLLAQAQHQLQQGALAEATTLVRRMQQADPGHAELPAVLATLAQRTEQQRRQIDEDLRRGRLERALSGCQSLLDVDPDDDGTRGACNRVAAALARRSERLASDFHFDAAEDALGKAAMIAPGLPAVAAARDQLAHARRSQARLQVGAPTPQRQQRLQRLLADAAAAEARGDLLLPPGESAFDKVRAARAIAPDDRRVRAASARLLPAAKACYERALRDNRLTAALACLDARAVLDPDTVGLRAARSRLAQRWIAVGNERLGAGELDAARRALESARALDATSPGLDELAERVRQAAAAER